MPRLFLTPREIGFFSDIAKELIKDVIDQKIFYYSVSELRTPASDVYGESMRKVFDPPVEIEALCDTPNFENTNDAFSLDTVVKISIYVQHSDMVDKGIEIKAGDFFSYGKVFYEISSVNIIKPIHGQVEHPDGFVITGLRARSTIIEQSVTHGPTDESLSDADAIQTEFVQQRGLPENKLGSTNDVRELQRRGVLERPLTGQRAVSSNGTSTNAAQSFYDE